MTDNNHTEEMKKEVERLFKEASDIEPGRAELVVHSSLCATDEEKRDQLKTIISGEFSAKMKAGDATEKLRKSLMRLRMLGDLLDITNDEQSPDEESVWVAGGLIWEWAEEARKAGRVLEDRWSELEDSKLEKSSAGAS